MVRKPRSGWELLVIHIAGRRGTTRMRVWRALRSAGAAVLRDGVYLLPSGEKSQVVFEEQAHAIRTAGGLAHVLPLGEVSREQEKSFRDLFDRGNEYAAWIARAQRLRASSERRRGGIGGAALRALRREYELIRAIDLFPGPAAALATEMLAEIETHLGVSNPDEGEPSAKRRPIRRLDARRYRRRRWATRARPWVDRMASAWLIRRFIDPKAKFVWLASPARRAKGAVGFDFDGAEFTHVGSRVTFEVLLASFGLEEDPALQRIGAIVHFLDVGGAPVPEAAGLAAVLAGARKRAVSDDALLGESNRIFESLYTTFLMTKGD